MSRVRVPKPAVIVSDIEGTTTSVRFWQDVLAPFVLNNVQNCLTEWWDRQECDDVIQVMRLSSYEAWMDKNNHAMPLILGDDKPRKEIIDSVVTNVKYQLTNTKYSAQVKPIILLVWLYGYETDKLKGHMYKDVGVAFKEWHKQNIQIVTFASGYRLSQEMLFCRSLAGNLRPLIKTFFDADHQGRKDDPASYRKIARDLDVSRASMIFLSDNIDELKAAEKAGLTSILVIRKHNEALKKQKDLPFKFINQFTDLEFFQATK